MSCAIRINISCNTVFINNDLGLPSPNCHSSVTNQKLFLSPSIISKKTNVLKLKWASQTHL
jgi:hypothetical protein